MAGTVPSQFKVVKTYPPRGLWQQYRLDAATQFSCDRCQKDKKAKLIAVKEGNWDSPRCNGCYGMMLSMGEERA
ncbi:hypothetical protein F4775DRAFT_548995 [Biscogniauxia sp. FL1348]|nr:hypothetical protein F4775DRAFT_548995 [Biscogniauxia sp. FL1348]